MTTEPRLIEVGEELKHAVARDLRLRHHQQAPPGRLSRPRLLAAAACLVVGAPSVALAAGAFSSPKTVAASLPAGTRFLLGSDPTCSTVTQGVEYRCTLAHPPVPYIGPNHPDGKHTPGRQDSTSGIASGGFKGTVEATVNEAGQVDGGARSLTADGSVWEVYVGQAAVTHGTIAEGLLGQHSDGPGAG